MVDGVNNFNLASYSRNVDKTNNVPPIVLYNRQPVQFALASQDDRFERTSQQEQRPIMIDPNDRFVKRIDNEKQDEQMLGANNLKAFIKPSQIDEGLKIIKNLYDGYETVEKFKNI